MQQAIADSEAQARVSAPHDTGHQVNDFIQIFWLRGQDLDFATFVAISLTTHAERLTASLVDGGLPVDDRQHVGQSSQMPEYVNSAIH